MPARKSPRRTPAAPGGKISAATSATAAVKMRRGLKRAARSTLLAAGLTVAQWSADLDAMEFKLFSPGVLDRLRAPITRFHD
jgi:hypothetical protein